MEKMCTKCREVKNVSEFTIDKNNKDGLKYQCKSCMKKYRKNNKEYCKQYNKVNKEKISMYHKQRYLNNKEEMDKYSKQYYINNKDKISIYRKQYRKDNKKKFVIRGKLYRDNNKEKLSKQKKIYRENNKEYYKQYYLENKEKLSKQKIQLYNSYAKYNVCYEKLTIDEEAKLHSDGITLEVKCKYCGKYFIPTNSQIQARLSALNNIGNARGDCYLYCSDNCKKSCPTYGQKKYPKGFKPISSREVNPYVRQLCFERDDWVCQICGATQEDAQLHCHHIEGYTQNPRLGNDVANTTTLCKKCHKKVHKLPGCKYHELKCDKD